MLRAALMAAPLESSALDSILALQLMIAWAGEGRCEPARLGWWETDVVDPAGGGDLWTRLLPGTAVWAGLEAAREAATRTDAKLRRGLPDPDRVRTLFFLGFEVDEQLDDRLRALKTSGTAPADALRFLVSPTGQLDDKALAGTLSSTTDAKLFTVTPAGRQLRGALPESPLRSAELLAAALVPLTRPYPMPFFRLA